MSDNSHQMTTRSKASETLNGDEYDSQDMITDDSSIDENGNLKGLIDYDCDDDFDHQELDKELNRLRKKPKRKKKRKKQKKKNWLKKKRKLMQKKRKKNLHKTGQKLFKM